MAEFDLVIRNGLLVSGDGSGPQQTDIGISAGIVTAIGDEIPRAKQEMDATGLVVVPGGVEAHCHIEQSSSAGLMGADDFYSGSVAAAFGGNTTIVPFAAQHRKQKLPEVLEDYHRRAKEKSILDYSFHIIISDPTEELLTTHLPAAIRNGLPSVKLFTAYDLVAISDEQFLEVASVCREHGAITLVHAENNAMVKWTTKRLLDRGYTAPRYHAVSHPALAEVEAVNRVLMLSRLADTSLVIVHVTCREALDAIDRARKDGLDVTAETCPQYLFFTPESLDLPDYDGAKMIFSPPPRRAKEHEVLWSALKDRRIELYHSDHAPYRMDASGKFARSSTPTFKEIASGIPGIELRLPLLFSEGVAKGRLSLVDFVALSSTNSARLYGMYPRKGCIALGSDADIAIWNPKLQRTVRSDLLHDNVGYSPYEGRSLTGWPVVVLQRGQVLVRDGKLQAKRGDGKFIPRQPRSRAKTATRSPDMEPENCFGAELL
jgi:dihydropyrimidinase